MKYKKSIIVLVLAIFLFSVASVCASDTNDAVGELSQADADEMVSFEETGLISLSQKEGISSEGNVGTFSELQNNITGKYGSTLILTKDYEHEDDFESNGIIINQSITIDGQGHKIDAQEKSRIFKITADNVILKNINFINANTTMHGGAVQFEKSGTVSDCNFTNNKATYIAAFGGAVYMDSGSVTNCNFVNNHAEHNGGAVFMRDGVMTNCNFMGNTAMYGSAVCFDSSNSVSVIDCNFINNTATGYGGAIKLISGSIENCNFTNNSADWGGAVYSDEITTVELKSCNFINNSANATGGAVYVYSEATLTDCNFTNNSADWGAAAIMDSGSLKDCNFANNYANNGSAIYFYIGGNVTNCNFTKNKATEKGGAIFTLDYINIFDSLFNNNIANNSGGAVYIDSSCSDSKISSAFINNSAKNGGAIYFNDKIENVTINSIFKDNDAERNGGAIYVQKQSMNSNFSSEFYNNKAINAIGGAIFFRNSVENNTFESIFANNYALYGGAIMFYNKANNNKFSSNFTSNVAKSCGGAMFFYNTTNNNNFTGYFYNNSALGQVDETVGNGGAITFKDVSTNCQFTCDFIDNSAALNGGGVNYRQTPHNITFNGNFINNTSPRGGGVNFFESFENVTFNGEFIGNSATNGGAIAAKDGIIKDVSFENNYAENGGAIFMDSGSVLNCNFTNNTANGNRKYGGAIAMSSGSIEKCNFNNNSAFYAGAVWFDGEGNVADCSFTNNKATGTTSWGGAIRMDYGNVGNSNFTNNSATYRGGAIFFNSFKYSGYVENCSFNNNTARLKGGAIYFTSTSSPSIAINCNFTDNRASDANGNGGAILIYSGSIENCDFNSNTAPLRGGAVYFDRAGNVTNCNFAHNKANYSTGNGGAIYFYNKGNVAICNFTNNSAVNRGGAIYFETACNLTDCNFEGNNATAGSAIYLFSTSAFKTIDNSTFLNNRAKSEDLEVIINENNITITFTGNDNLLNAIYSRNDAEVTFTNVTYWSANGIANTGSSPITPARSNKESGQNITVAVVVNDEIVLSGVKVTDENGTIVLDISAGENYFIGVRHDMDSYYTEALKTVSNNTEFNVNVTSQTTNNKTVNITAKSNIPNEIINGELSFLVLNGTEISANYGGNGTWWAVYGFDNAGDYNVNASYIGLDNVTINNALVSIRLDASVDVINKTLELLIDDTFTIVATTTPEGLNVTFVPDDSGVYSIDGTGKLTALKEGTGSILVKVGGDGIYAENSTTVNVTVNKIPTEITVGTDSLDLFVGDEHGIVANLTPADAGNVSFKSSNEDLVLVEDDGNVIANGVGQAIITVSFAGNDKYAAAQNKTINVTVRLNDASVSVDNDTLDLNVGETYAINATKHPDTILLDIKYTSSNSSVATVDENGVVTAVGKGTAVITVSVGDDEIYAKNSTNVAVTVNDVEVTVSDLVKYYSSPERLVVNVTKNGKALSNLSVEITINGVTYTRTTDSDGVASLAINLNEGNYSASVEVPDYEISKTVDVIVKSTIYAKDIVKVFRNGTQYNALFLDGNGNNLTNTTVRFNINGVFYNRTTNASGWATLNINLIKGSYILTATNPVTGEMKSNNITVISKLQTSDLTKYFRNDTQFVVRAVADDGTYAGAGETVTFNINGVFYNRTTNETGHAKLNINLMPGDYIITSYYDGCAEGNNVCVLPTLTGNDLNMTYGDKSQFTANLVDGQGNPYANQNITFNINGVFYTRTTDANGDAKLNINLQAGEYIITSSYADAVIANKITITS